MAKKTLFRLQFESDYRIVGLFCREPAYRLCWLINNQFGINFKMVHDFTPNPDKGRAPDSHLVFLHKDNVLCQEYYIISNRGSNGSLIFASPPNIDFLMLVKADDSRFDGRDLLKGLRLVPEMVAAYMLDDLLGRKKEGFLYDFEEFIARKP